LPTSLWLFKWVVSLIHKEAIAEDFLELTIEDRLALLGGQRRHAQLVEHPASSESARAVTVIELLPRHHRWLRDVIAVKLKEQKLAHFDRGGEPTRRAGTAELLAALSSLHWLWRAVCRLLIGLGHKLRPGDAPLELRLGDAVLAISGALQLAAAAQTGSKKRSHCRRLA